MSPFLMIHICAAVIGLLSGFLAIFLRKGSGWHSAAGNVFFVSMMTMSASAAYVATFLRPNRVNFTVGVLTFYLVATAWVAARRRDGKPGMFDRVALLVVFIDGAQAMGWGFKAAGSPGGTLDHMPAFLYFAFGSIALLCAYADVRMIRRGGFTGGKRIARHLWRMCFALWIAAMSFYPGQAKLFSKAVRDTNLLILPQFLIIGVMVFSLWRVLRSNKKKTTPVALNAPPQPNAVTV